MGTRFKCLSGLPLATVEGALRNIETTWYVHHLLMLPPGLDPECVPEHCKDGASLRCAQTLDHFESGLRLELTGPLCEYHERLAHSLRGIPSGETIR